MVEFWAAALALSILLYVLLDGFDLGVGMHMLVGVRGDAAEKNRQRRVMLNTIGPVWDGNEVWLLTAGAATFAAFPFWYASLFSTLYVPLTLVLLGLIFRAVAIEFRGKHHTARWAKTWDWAIGLGSFVSAFEEWWPTWGGNVSDIASGPSDSAAFVVDWVRYWENED